MSRYEVTESAPYVGVKRTVFTITGTGTSVTVDEREDGSGEVLLTETNVDALRFKHSNAIGAGRALVASLVNAQGA